MFKNRENLNGYDPQLPLSELTNREINTLRIARTLFALGFYEEGKSFANEWLALSNDDHLGYSYNLLWAGIINNRHEETYRYGLETPENQLYDDYMAINLLFMGRYSEALYYLKQFTEKFTDRSPYYYALIDMLYGYAYQMTGNLKESENHYYQSEKFIVQYLKSNPKSAIPDFSYAITDRYWKSPVFALASIYSARGRTREAMTYLRTLKKNYLASDLQVVTLLKKWPMFQNIRNEDEFQQYLREAEKHFSDEHKKVKKLLSSKGLSPDI